MDRDFGKSPMFGKLLTVWVRCISGDLSIRGRSIVPDFPVVLFDMLKLPADVAARVVQAIVCNGTEEGDDVEETAELANQVRTQAIFRSLALSGLKIKFK